MCNLNSSDSPYDFRERLHLVFENDDFCGLICDRHKQGRLGYGIEPLGVGDILGPGEIGCHVDDGSPQLGLVLDDQLLWVEQVSGDLSVFFHFSEFSEFSGVSEISETASCFGNFGNFGKSGNSPPSAGYGS